MGIIRKIIRVLSTIVDIAILVYALVCLPAAFKYNPIVVLSGSMEPNYKTGSVIYYKQVSEEELKVGDVITFQVNGTLISHRIVSIENGLIETKGDANNVPDAMKIQMQNVIGKVANISIPYLGYYIKFINDNLSLSVIATVLILVSEFLSSNVKTFGINRKNGRSERDAKR